MSPKLFNSICQGMFQSKLLYCLQLFGNTWGVLENDDTQRKYTAFTKSDNQKLQVLQNKMMRMKTGLPYRTPTVDLTEAAGQLSVHQLTAYTSLLTVHKSLVRGQPQYFKEKLSPRFPSCSALNGSEVVVPRRQEYTLSASSNLTISRGGFFFRGATLFNKLPLNLRTSKNEIKFKREVKSWVKQNIDVKPG